MIKIYKTGYTHSIKAKIKVQTRIISTIYIILVVYKQKTGKLIIKIIFILNIIIKPITALTTIL